LPRSTSKTPRESSVESDLKAILENRADGASSIADAIFDLFNSIIQNSGGRHIAQMKRAIRLIRGRFSQMANIVTLLNFAERSMVALVPDDLIIALTEFRRGIDENRKSTIVTTAAILSGYKMIFTISNSTIVRKAAISARKIGWNGAVKIIESRPGNEGTILAETLAKAGISTMLAVDTVLPELIKGSDAVFLGADAVTQTYFVNKIGSRMAIDYARRYDKPVFVAADIGKFISNRKYRFAPDDNPTTEITGSKRKRLEIVNSYFEKVKPAGRFQYICGRQLFSPAGVKNILKHQP
jgi:translation initiation factor 2B subunit (eIF-2B alpha/beta/delta family)